MKSLQPLLAAIALLLSLPLAADEQLLVATDLRLEAQLSRARSLPIVIMLSAEGCTYCIQMEEQFLRPMVISGDYEEKAILRKIEVGAELIDFAGRRVAVEEFAGRYRAFVTPTLLFLDSTGEALTDKMVGLTTPDFFGGYLDASIDDALARLRGSASLGPSGGE